MSKKRFFANLGMIAIGLVPGGGLVAQGIREGGKLVFGALLDNDEDKEELYPDAIEAAVARFDHWLERASSLETLVKHLSVLDLPTARSLIGSRRP